MPYSILHLKQMHPSSHHQNTTHPPFSHITTIFDIASHIVECIEQAERIYFIKDSIPPSNLSQIGGLSINDGIWELPIQPRAEVFVNPIKFLMILKDVLISKSEKVLEEEENCKVIVSSIEVEKVRMKIWKNIESQDHIYSLRIECPENQILKVTLKQMHTSSLKKRIQIKLKERYYAQSTFKKKIPLCC